MSATGAELLNDKWDALSQRFDLLKTVPRDQAQLINAAISDWQDWYWDKYEAWPSTELLAWQDRYVKTARLLDAVAAKTVVVSDVTKTDDYRAPTGKVTTLPPLLITAKPPPRYVPPPPIVYEEAPYLPPPRITATASMGGVDTSGWGKTDWGTFSAYSRDPGTVGWTPGDTNVRLNRTGLGALLAGVTAAIIGKKQGWL